MQLLPVSFKEEQSCTPSFSKGWKQLALNLGTNFKVLELVYCIFVTVFIGICRGITYELDDK